MTWNTYPDDPDPGPLEHVARAGRRVDQRQSFALADAANNLLDKAATALAAGDEERARGYVARALRLPFDTHERLAPGLRYAGHRLFSALTDAAEGSDEDDQAWIDAAEALLPTVRGHVHAALVNLLGVIAHDADFLGVTETEARRLSRQVPNFTVTDLPEDEVPEGEREDYVLGLLRLTLDYERQLTT